MNKSRISFSDWYALLRHEAIQQGQAVLFKNFWRSYYDQGLTPFQALSAQAGALAHE